LRDVANHLASVAASLSRTAPPNVSFAGTAQFRGGITESTTASGVLTSIVLESAGTATERSTVGIVITPLAEAGSAEPITTLDSLDAAAATGDRRLFADQARAVDWGVHPPEALLQAIDLALRLELAETAITLAQRGAQLFSDDECVQRAARLLAPPVVRNSSPPRAHGLEASRQWLREEAHRYRGHRVAVRDGQLIGAAPSLRELQATIDADADSVSIIVTKVL
jgi:hypothetical protein